MELCLHIHVMSCFCRKSIYDESYAMIQPVLCICTKIYAIHAMLICRDIYIHIEGIHISYVKR